jgi:hypothetical protein
MAQRLKRWESPRKEGRNDKGRGGSARQRQLKKQRQALRRRLKETGDGQLNQDQGGEDASSLPFGIHPFSPSPQQEWASTRFFAQ